MNGYVRVLFVTYLITLACVIYLNTVPQTIHIYHDNSAFTIMGIDNKAVTIESRNSKIRSALEYFKTSSDDVPVHKQLHVSKSENVKLKGSSRKFVEIENDAIDSRTPKNERTNSHLVRDDVIFNGSGMAVTVRPGTRQGERTNSGNNARNSSSHLVHDDVRFNGGGRGMDTTIHPRTPQSERTTARNNVRNSSSHLTHDDVIFNVTLLALYHNTTMKYRHSGICPGLFANDSRSLKQAITFSRSFDRDFHLDLKLFPTITKNCKQYKSKRGFMEKNSSKEELEFPLAFSILTYDNIQQFERMLRVLYTPQNVYCIHVDNKSSEYFKNAVRSITNCFSNVFIASKLETIVYASITRLQADINCMADLLHREEKWRYLLNFAASEMPLKSNIEMVQTLKIFRGANDIHEVFAKRVKHRYLYKYVIENSHIHRGQGFLAPPPFNITIVKGQAYNLFSRRFVEFSMKNKIARRFLKWCADTYSPDEHYWASLNDLYHNTFLNTPGGYKGHPDKKEYVTRHINWRASYDRCYGEFVRGICVFGYGDLPLLKRKGQFGTNKFDLRKDPIAYSCMEELLSHRVQHPPPVYPNHWKNLNFIKNSNT
ncbi:beta-1,3-galactosyl-O-glycosyl-glycoprotein beta-1,6-N-acetylglucosaminyltransferase 3 [Patella vulgata]|uniref:beta-1,3-galactosyl-O-glycosyl-glycoprotein beta-1,6-N-acetylglucosaminyltransferase 3 n=1 Tax=Patella vulgata TaxID=6465 RepID=UPI0024A8A733|nr:beta-1,3-galactosyl-O-glycosyl-glycoprotein beta-1,6-N-acetylglucosaminyltransferase 3 [Patella vulgata]